MLPLYAELPPATSALALYWYATDGPPSCGCLSRAQWVHLTPPPGERTRHSFCPSPSLRGRGAGKVLTPIRSRQPEAPSCSFFSVRWSSGETQGAPGGDSPVPRLPRGALSDCRRW